MVWLSDVEKRFMICLAVSIDTRSMVTADQRLRLSVVINNSQKPRNSLSG